MNRFEVLKRGRELPERLYKNVEKVYVLLTEISDLRVAIKDFIIGGLLVGLVCSLGTAIIGVFQVETVQDGNRFILYAVVFICLCGFFGWDIGRYRYGHALKIKIALLWCYSQSNDRPHGLGQANFLETLWIIREISPGLYMEIPRTMRREFRKFLDVLGVTASKPARS